MAINSKNIIRPHKGFQENFTRSNVDVVIGGGQLGGGKLLSVNELVLTPNGWVKNGTLKKGDIICTPFGKPTKIIEIFPHKNKDIYTLTTKDGRKCMAGLEHLWEVRTRKQIHNYRKHHENKNFFIMTTEEIMEGMKKGNKYFIPIPHAQEFSEKDFVIHPYVLGVLIGDGLMTPKTWNTKNYLKISNSERDIIEKVCKLVDGKKIVQCSASYTKEIYTTKTSAYKDYLEKVGLTTYSYNKFIPQEYLWGSIEQRRQLLYGLMDTDGCVESKNRYSYSTTSKRLADDFIYLCRSLGYIATIGKDERKDKYTKNVAYNIRIQTNDVIFSSKKHLERYHKNKELIKENGFYLHNNDHVRIESIEYKCTEDALCLFVEDKDHLYIAGDFLTTHNSFGAILSAAEPSLDKNFRAVFLRNNLGDLKSGGGILDDFSACYGKGCKVIESGDPHVDFAKGSRIDVTHIADQSKKVLEKRMKGRQYDLIYFDEMTGFTWECFTFMFSRNRGKGKWTGKMRGTTNPKRSHWLRIFLDWYIGIDGEIIEEREGVVRYFFNAGKTVKEVVWGDSKEEVYRKCKLQIDRFLRKFNGKTGTATYKDVIKSFTFYLGRTSENSELGPSYAGSVAAMGAKNAEENSGNWNVDTDEDEESAIKQDKANEVFINDPQTNNDGWITADLADIGTDNFLALHWDGFHADDILILCESTPRQNAEYLKMFAMQHDVADCHIIYDGIRGTYINDYIPDAIPFMSTYSSKGMYRLAANRLKDECYMRLVDMINRGDITFSSRLADMTYKHQNLKENVTIQNEFLDECSVVQFQKMPSGKLRLLPKKMMNQKLGNNRSMDLLDPCAMRMLPVLDVQYGEELSYGIEDFLDDEYNARENIDIFDNTLFS